MSTALEDLKAARAAGAYTATNSDAEAVAIERMLDLLERGAADTEPGAGLEFAGNAWSWGRTDTRKNRAVEAWKRYFPKYVTSDPIAAIQRALADTFIPRDYVTGIITQTLAEIGVIDPAKAQEYGEKIRAAAKEDNTFSEAVQAGINIAIARFSFDDLYLENLRGDRILTNDELEARLQHLYEIACFTSPNGGYQTLAIGLWAKLFDHYAHGNFSNENLQEKAARLALDLLKKTPSDSPMSRQIAASLLALGDHAPFPGFERPPMPGMNSPIMPHLS